MQIPFRSGVHAALVGQDLVLLDVRADRYACLPDALTPGPHGELVLTTDALRRLEEAKLLGVAGPQAPAPSLQRPSQGLADMPGVKAGPAEARRLAACMGDFAVGYLGRTFERLLAAGVAGAPAAPTGPTAELLRMASLFERLAVWAPIPRKCLARSFLLMRFLSRAGLRAQWVFGVRTWPFAAHCWVQAGDVALDDAPERLARYTPILAV